MRSDMSKVIVERPRLRNPLRAGSAYPRGYLENRWAPDLENAPRTESMGGRYAKKRLNENLAPLVRFLRSNVGRPWDDVHSEIAARISCRSAVQKHVLDHLRDYVVKHVSVEGGAVFYMGYRGLEPLVSSGGRLRFYVEPRTGALLLAPCTARNRRSRRDVDPGRRILSRERELRRIEGVWYDIAVAPIPREIDARAACFDVIERTGLSGSAFDANVSNVLWRAGRFAARKRQLCTKELERFGLRREP
jgi:hypothetical protein